MVSCDFDINSSCSQLKYREGNGLAKVHSEPAAGHPGLQDPNFESRPPSPANIMGWGRNFAHPGVSVRALTDIVTVLGGETAAFALLPKLVSRPSQALPPLPEWRTRGWNNDKPVLSRPPGPESEHCSHSSAGTLPIPSSRPPAVGRAQTQPPYPDSSQIVGRESSQDFAKPPEAF